MGRRPGNKITLDNVEIKKEWALKLLPHFQKKGIKKFNMDQVALVLNKSKATVYKYFRSRDEILEIIVGYRLKKISQFEETIKDESLTWEERYFSAVEILSTSVGDISTPFLYDLKKYHPDVWKMIEVFKENAVESFSNFYLQGMKKNEIKKYDVSILKIADRLFFSALLDPEFLNENSLSLRTGFQQYFQLKWKGIKTSS